MRGRTISGYAFLLVLVVGPWGLGQDAEGPGAPEAAGGKGAARDSAPPPGEDWPRPLVPKAPRTAEERRELDALLDYVGARALEARRDWRAALDRYEQALKDSPGSPPILRRAARLAYLLGRAPDSLRYAEQALDAEPGDLTMLSLVLEHYLRRNDAAGAEAMLVKARDNPKLDPRSAGHLWIERCLGDFLATRDRRMEEAAKAYAKVVEGLEARRAEPFTRSEVRQVLGGEEADAYLRFGAVFYDTRRFDLAIQAFQRGLAYDPDHTEIPRYLATALLRVGRPEKALEVLEPFLRRQPQGREPYDLLIEVLTALKRSNEDILKRLEAAALNDSKNAALQYLLAERYRELGQRAKADALYRKLIATQPDPQGYGALALTYFNERRASDLIQLLGDANSKSREAFEAVKPQIEAVVNDPEFASKVLAAGLELQQAAPPRLTSEARQVLAYIAINAKKLDEFIPIQRLALKSEKNPQAYLEFWLDLYRNGKFAEAADVVEDMLERFPQERTPQRMIALAQTRWRAGQFEPALEAVDSVLKLNPNDPNLLQDALRIKGFLLGGMGRNDEAIAHYKGIVEKYPANDELLKLAHSGLSIIYVNMEDFDRGEAELEVLYQRDPEDPGVNNDLGYLYADRGKNLEKAEAMIRKAIADQPNNAAYLDSLGWVLYRQGRIEEAMGPLERAVEEGDTDATIHDHLGDVYFKLQKLDKAKQAWETAARLAAEAKPPDKRLAEIQKKLESLAKLDPAFATPKADKPKP